MTLTPERLAELRSKLNRMPTKLDLNTMWHATYGLLDEIDRLRAVIRSTHSEFCEGVERLQRHLPGCKLYEIES